MYLLTGESTHLLPICKQDRADPLCAGDETGPREERKVLTSFQHLLCARSVIFINSPPKHPPHCINVDTEDQRGAVTCPESHSKELAEAECKPRSFQLQNLGFGTNMYSVGLTDLSLGLL